MSLRARARAGHCRSASSRSSSAGSVPRRRTTARSSRIRGRTITAGGPSFSLPCRPRCSSSSGRSALPSISTGHIDAQLSGRRPPTARSPARRSSLSLVKSLANGLRKLDAETLANLPQTFAELQPLLAAKGVALATDTQDYMIPIAVEANAHAGPARPDRRRSSRSSLSLAGAVYARPRRSRRASRARNSVERLMLWGAARAPRPSPS